MRLTVSRLAGMASPPRGGSAVRSHVLFNRVGGVLLLAISLAVALVLLPSPGTSDVTIFWLPWMDQLSARGLVEGYQHISQNYPPLGHLFLFVVARLGDAVGVSHFVALKAALFVFQLADVAMMLAFSRSLWIAAAFNAAITLDGVGLAYLDVVFVPFLIGALLAWRAGRPLLGATLFALTVLIKWQPVLLAPFILLYLLEVSDVASARQALRSVLLWRLGLLSAVISALLLTVFGLEPIRALLRASRDPYFSGYAINMPWLEGWIAKVLFSPSYSALEPLEPWTSAPGLVMTVQKAIFAMGMLYVLYLFLRAVKSFANLLLASLTGFVTYAILNTGVHENHLVTAIVLAFLLVAHDGRRDGRFAIGSPRLAAGAVAMLLAAMLNANLFFFYGVTGLPVTPRVVGMDISVTLALCYVAAWAALVWHLRAALGVATLAEGPSTASSYS